MDHGPDGGRLISSINQQSSSVVSKMSINIIKDLLGLFLFEKT